jgi:hypothetical protein
MIIYDKVNDIFLFMILIHYDFKLRIFLCIFNHVMTIFVFVFTYCDLTICEIILSNLSWQFIYLFSCFDNL